MEEDQQSDEETPASGHEKNSKTPITKTGENFENSFDDSQDASGEVTTAVLTQKLRAEILANHPILLGTSDKRVQLATVVSKLRRTKPIPLAFRYVDVGWRAITKFRHAKERKCEDCNIKKPFFGLQSERKARWCGGCSKAHPGSLPLERTTVDGKKKMPKRETYAYRKFVGLGGPRGHEEL